MYSLTSSSAPTPLFSPGNDTADEVVDHVKVSLSSPFLSLLTPYLQFWPISPSVYVDGPTDASPEPTSNLSASFQDFQGDATLPATTTIEQVGDHDGEHGLHNHSDTKSQLSSNDDDQIVRSDDKPGDDGPTNEQQDLRQNIEHEAQPGEVVIICTACTKILLVEYNGNCPFSSITANHDEYESSAWMLHTTCKGCLKKLTGGWFDSGDLASEAADSFSKAMLSEKFVKQMKWYGAAEQVCRNSVKVVINTETNSALGASIDIMRDELSETCKIMGVNVARAWDDGRNALEFPTGNFF